MAKSNLFDKFVIVFFVVGRKMFIVWLPSIDSRRFLTKLSTLESISIRQYSSILCDRQIFSAKSPCPVQLRRH